MRLNAERLKAVAHGQERSNNLNTIVFIGSNLPIPMRPVAVHYWAPQVLH